jgi:hypothetical protein
MKNKTQFGRIFETLKSHTVSGLEGMETSKILETDMNVNPSSKFPINVVKA